MIKINILLISEVLNV